MSRSSSLLLDFSPALEPSGKPLQDGLSVAAFRENTLWLANDETLRLERLTLRASGATNAVASDHVAFSLADCLDLPIPPGANPEAVEEADLEGLDWVDDTLWLVGSHSLKRKRPKPDDDADKAVDKLAQIGRDGNRYLLACLPLARDGASWRPVRRDGQRHAASLKGDAHGNRLTEALGDDEHLAPFLALPGKDNGFDIEGLAVIDGRVFLGLRGPVLRGWAVILELRPKIDPDSPRRLRLHPPGGGTRVYRKHFLQLGGLGVRDLCRQGDDLLILAGPSMELDGPVRVLRWVGAARPHKAGAVIPAADLPVLLELPYGQGVDHAEGMTLFSPDGGDSPALLVVYDAADDARKRGGHGVMADIFPLPG
ncbi:MAG: hypothetical protein B7Y41_09490 [Hydrogenophilales bacterium 28-61-23]|nr:MAG: hypothetical protein B7Y41_09490 [Hydrogenophilales bacterium 28-61-23]